MDKHFVLSKIKDYEAHLDNVAPLMESDDQLIMNELIREINNTCHVKIRGFSDLCDSYIKGAGSIIAKHINRVRTSVIVGGTERRVSIPVSGNEATVIKAIPHNSLAA